MFIATLVEVLISAAVFFADLFKALASVVGVNIKTVCFNI